MNRVRADRRDGRGRIRSFRGAALVASIATLTACAPLQRVELEVEPIPESVFVDGQAVTPVPTGLDLRADRDHKLYFKRDGFKPELVVLQSVTGDEGPVLEPSRVRVRLRPLDPGGRDVRIEQEDDASP